MESLFFILIYCPFLLILFPPLLLLIVPLLLYALFSMIAFYVGTTQLASHLPSFFETFFVLVNKPGKQEERDDE